MVSYLERKKPANGDDPIDQHYQTRCNRLEGELHDADRKIRQQVDEIMQLKRELSEDRTETLLTHQKELSDQKESHRNENERLKEDHRREIKDYEKQVSELEKQAFKMEMEHRAGGRDAGSRVLDMLEENAPMFVSVVSQMIAGQTQGNPHPGQSTSLQPAPKISEEQAEEIARQFQAEMNRNGQSKSDDQASRKEATTQEGEQGSSQPNPAVGQNEPGQESQEEFMAENRNGHPEQQMEL